MEPFLLTQVCVYVLEMELNNYSQQALYIFI